MSKPAFSEVIKVKDGLFYNLKGHAARMSRTCRHFFGRPPDFELSPRALPKPPLSGLIKCRLVYSDQLEDVEYSPYVFKEIKSLTLIRADQVRYPFKSIDRRALQELTASVQTDDVLVVQYGAITDTSFANVVFEGPEGLVTPETCLLPGTKRELLLGQGWIRKRPILVSDLDRFEKIHLINAMMDLEDEVAIPLAALDRSRLFYDFGGRPAGWPACWRMIVRPDQAQIGATGFPGSTGR